ncbi:hypothetical protein [Lentibacillus amyloliquefaciens]|uniref:Lipoprotein n=1 Tax=Lentibacillus amyloliquefaciens TaxID=1472767 RepID=A0A0U3W992_9BACI|nr:hypothetical protein [Lentibacillus amyloliquefaciens]ALX49664.1 hypothetical protein AOX59_14460 [Lentibacillus amyloliquefaciens]
MNGNHFLKLITASLFALLLLTACGGASSTEGSADEGDAGGSEEADSQEDTSSDEDKEDGSEEAQSSESGSSDEDTSGAVKPQSASESISFEQVSWLGGVPDRQPEAGVWYYNQNDHPEKYADTFNWEEEDILLWQIGDEKYKGYDADTGKLEIMDDDVIKIVVELEADETDDERAPRNYLKVPKGELEGKSFIVETVDGEQLSIQ